MQAPVIVPVHHLLVLLVDLQVSHHLVDHLAVLVLLHQMIRHQVQVTRLVPPHLIGPVILHQVAHR